MQTAIVLAAIYIVVNLVLTWIATWAQRKFVGEKAVLVTDGGDQSATTGFQI